MWIHYFAAHINKDGKILHRVYALKHITTGKQQVQEQEHMHMRIHHSPTVTSANKQNEAQLMYQELAHFLGKS